MDIDFIWDSPTSQLSQKAWQQRMREAIGHCLPDRDVLKGSHVAVRAHLRPDILRRPLPSKKHEMRGFVWDFSLNDEWWTLSFTSAEAMRGSRRQIYGETRTVIPRYDPRIC